MLCLKHIAVKSLRGSLLPSCRALPFEACLLTCSKPLLCRGAVQDQVQEGGTSNDTSEFKYTPWLSWASFSVLSFLVYKIGRVIMAPT